MLWSLRRVVRSSLRRKLLGRSLERDLSGLVGPGEFVGTDIGTDFLAHLLSGQPDVGRLVVDQTELKGLLRLDTQMVARSTRPKPTNGNHANARWPSTRHFRCIDFHSSSGTTGPKAGTKKRASRHNRDRQHRQAFRELEGEVIRKESHGNGHQHVGLIHGPASHHRLLLTYGSRPNSRSLWRCWRLY